MQTKEDYVNYRIQSILWGIFLPLSCCGCSHAPSVDVFGSFFPAWMLCVSLGIITAGIVRWLLVRLKFEAQITFPILFYPGVAVSVACMVWLSLFR